MALSPFEGLSISVGTTPQLITFPYPLSAVSIHNDGTGTVKVWTQNGGQVQIYRDEEIDLELPITSPLMRLYAVTDSGTATVRITGVRQFDVNDSIPKPEVDLTKQPEIPLRPHPVSIYQDGEPIQTGQPDYMPYMITLGIIGIIVVAIVAIAYKR